MAKYTISLLILIHLSLFSVWMGHLPGALHIGSIRQYSRDGIQNNVLMAASNKDDGMGMYTTPSSGIYMNYKNTTMTFD